MKQITYRFRNIVLICIISVLAVSTANARLIFTTEDDGTASESYRIDREGASTTFIDLAFGSDLTNRLRYDVSTDTFILSDSLNLSAQELQNFIVEKLAADPTACNAGAEGRMYYNTVDSDLLYCNGTTWVTLQVGGVGSITSSDIADGTITADDLGTDSVDSDEIATGAVGTDEIADGSVTGTDIGSATITQTNLANDSVGSAQIIDGSVTADDLGTDSVDSDEIAADAVTASEIATGAVGTDEIADGSITLADISARTGTFTLSPEFQNFTIVADGSANSGTLE